MNELDLMTSFIDAFEQSQGIKTEVNLDTGAIGYRKVKPDSRPLEELIRQNPIVEEMKQHFVAGIDKFKSQNNNQQGTKNDYLSWR